MIANDNTFHGIDIVRFGNNINIMLDRETFEKISLLYQFEKTMKLIPEEAFREAIANALGVFPTKTSFHGVLESGTAT